MNKPLAKPPSVGTYTLLMFLALYAFVFPFLVGWPTSCPFKLVTGLPCPSCNITHAVEALARFDFAGAFHYNPSVFLLPLAAVALVVERLFRSIDKKVFYIIYILIIVLIIISYIIRMALYFPDEPMSYYRGSLFGRLIDAMRGL